MKLRLLLSLSLLLFAWQKAGAQLAPPDDFFNSGAQLYISNNIPAALERVETGLKIYPDNVKLKKLEQLLKQQQQSQSQQNQKNQQQNQQNKSQQQQSKNSQQNSQSQNSNGQQNQQQPKQGQQNQQQSPGAKQENGGKQGNQNQPEQPSAPGQMTPEEAKRLLDSQKGNEQILQMKPPEKPQDNTHSIKDW